MDLTTQYLGMSLRSPLVPSASPLSEDLASIRQMEDSGAAAVVLHSLFEEQLAMEQMELFHNLSSYTDSFAEALTFFPEPSEFRLGPEAYLEHISKAKAAVSIPIIASLNGSSTGGWTDYARNIQQAGADALELNIYHIPTDMSLTGDEVEQTYLDILRAVKSAVTIPIAVKLSPYFSNMANMARRLDYSGAAALVLFNRFYQPDIDLELLEVRPHLLLSTPQALRLPLTWIGILYGRTGMDLAATSGINTASDVLKMLMAGANITMMASALLTHGIGHLQVVERDLVSWMEEHEYVSVRQMQGSLSQIKCPDPAAFERAQYIKSLKGFRHTAMA